MTRGAIILSTYLCQAAALAAMAATAWVSWFAFKHGVIWTLPIQAVIFTVNLGLFLFQWRIRRRLGGL